MSARLGEAVLSRKLGQHAVVLRERAGHAGWSPERVELAVCALFGARLLALTAGRERFGRDDVRAVAPALGDALAAPLVQWLDTGDPALRASFDAALALLCAARAPSLPASAALLAFYEPFLAAYDPELRRERGVYFTPPELAVYVVRRVDRWLVEEGGVADGLAASLVMLDPACGSGVFLSAAVSCIHARCVAHWQRRRLTPPELAAAWQRYVPEQLLPRLCGFDVLPSACALAQLQVRVALAETGYRSDGRETVAIERADALALLASRDERLARAEVILGNPPYARGGTGRGAFWDELLAPYKTSMRGERNLQPLADDYVRFARLAEHLLARKSLAVAALVTNSTFLHGHLHRDMRASLASTFPRIEVLDLGGSTRRHARGTRTGRDENVFGVAQGIAVTLFGRAPRLSPAPVRHAALHGARAWKLEQLATPETIAWQPLGEQPASSLPFVPRSIVASEYAAFPSLLELFDFSSVAAKPGDDRHLVAFERDALVPQLEAFRAALRADPSLAKTEAARRVLDYEAPFDPSRVIPYAYRPFDTRFVYDDPRIWTRAVSRLRARIDGEPLLLATRFARDGAFAHVFATRLLPDVIFLSNKTSVNCFAFPRAALRVEAARDALGDAPERNAFFAYLYAILHATRYRERYAPAFAEGFPRIPMPTSRASFDRLAALGERLLALHLDEPVDAPATPTVPDAIRTASARDLACFESFAGASWHARIGGYQVCHKWLLDRARAGRTLDAAERARFASLVRALDATRACIVELDAAVELIAPAWAAAPPSQSA